MVMLPLRASCANAGAPSASANAAAPAAIGERTGQVFYVWFSVFNLFATMLFWALMADRFSQPSTTMSEPLTPTAHVPEANKHLMFTIPFTDYAPRFTASSAYST